MYPLGPKTETAFIEFHILIKTVSSSRRYTYGSKSAKFLKYAQDVFYEKLESFEAPKRVPFVIEKFGYNVLASWERFSGSYDCSSLVKRYIVRIKLQTFGYSAIVLNLHL